MIKTKDGKDGGKDGVRLEKFTYYPYIMWRHQNQEKVSLFCEVVSVIQ